MLTGISKLHHEANFRTANYYLQLNHRIIYQLNQLVGVADWAHNTLYGKPHPARCRLSFFRGAPGAVAATYHLPSNCSRAISYASARITCLVTLCAHTVSRPKPLGRPGAASHTKRSGRDRNVPNGLVTPGVEWDEAVGLQSGYQQRCYSQGRSSSFPDVLCASLSSC